MSRNLTRVWPLLVLAFAGEVWALGLGDIRLSSALNEPLNAEIELLSATLDELEYLDITLASQETFERYGIDRPLFLQGINFVVFPGDGTAGNVIKVTSQGPIAEPFVTFLVEATWPRGSLLREYTLLLDPPTFAPPSIAESTSAVTAPRQSTQTDSGVIERPASPQTAPPPPTPEPASAAMPEPASAAFDTSEGGTYRVQRGDTLWEITQRVRPDDRLTMNQTMLAIFEANPEAFDGNINLMRAGANLRIPSADDIFNISRGDALSEVRRQNTAWSGASPDSATQPSLVLVPPDDDQTGYDGGVSPSVSDAGDAATADRIRQLEQQIDDQASLLEVRDNELAALRAELARLRSEEVPEPGVVDDSTDVLPADDDAVIDTAVDPMAADDATIDTAVDPMAADDAAIIGEGDSEDIGVEDAGAADDSEPDTTTTTAPPRVVTAPTADEPGLVGSVIETLSGFWGILIGGLVVVLGVLVWFARRAARGGDQDSTGVWDALDADDLDAESVAATERLSSIAREDDSAIVVVEQETALTPEQTAEMSIGETIEAPAHPQELAEETIEQFADEDTLEEPVEEPTVEPAISDTIEEATAEEVGIEDTFSSDTAMNLDQADPVAEADFHMAYGLYDQAADLIDGALALEPDRQDLLAKLCEIYFVWGNRDSFIEAASNLRTALAGASSADWDKTVIMGQQIASDHEMFAGAGGGMAATHTIDLSFEGALDEESELDIDFADGADADYSNVIDLGEDDDDLIVSSDDDQAGFDELFDTAESEAAPEEVATTESSHETSVTMPGMEETFATAEMPTTEMPTVEASIGEPDVTAESPTVEAAYSGHDATAETPTVEAAFDGQDFAAEAPTVEAPMGWQDSTLETPTVEAPMGGQEATVETPTIEEQFQMLEETAGMPALSDDEATKVATLDDYDEDTGRVDSTAEIELDDLGLDLAGADETALASDLDDTSDDGEALQVDDDLAATGADEPIDEVEATAATREIPAFGTGDGPGTGTDVDVDVDVDVEDTLGATGDTDFSAAEDRGGMSDLVEPEDTDIGVEIDTSLLDATGQTQILPEDADLEAAGIIGDVISDEERTLLAPGYDDDDTVGDIPDDVETLLAPMDDEPAESTVIADTDEDFDFAGTEALPEDTFTDVETAADTGNLPGIAETDMDLDLDDLTAALRLSEAGDTVNQPSEDATVEQPRPTEAVDLDVGESIEEADEGSTRLMVSDDASDDLHDARTMTEVGTKLDLARAYVDMGDPEGARSILDEVLDEGDEAQKQQAQQLLDSLPG
jgi:pilus assembly protein FimV